MSYTLWYGRGDNDCLVLPGVIRLPKLMAEIAGVKTDDTRFSKLYGLQQTLDDAGADVISAKYLKALKLQSRLFLNENGETLSRAAKDMLAQLAAIPKLGGDGD